MDLLNLGSQSRKTGIRPRQNLRRDEYDMEDIDDFFEDSDTEDTVINGRLDKPGRGGRDGSNVKERDIVARKINFTEDETDKFDLSPISINKNDDIKSGKKLAKSKDKLKIQQKPKQTFTKLFVPSSDDIPESNQEIEQNFDDIRFDDDLNEPMNESMNEQLDDMETPEAINTNDEDNDDLSTNPQLISPSSKSISSLTKNMALGKTKSNKRKSNPKPSSTRVPKSTITKPSPLPSPPPDGLRRSKRTKITPLAYWRGERIVYSRADEFNNDPDTTLIEDIHKIPLQEIKEVIHVTPVQDTLRKKRKTSKNNSNQSSSSNSRSNSKSKSKNDDSDVYDYESDPEVIGSEWFKSKTLELSVYNDQDSENTTLKPIAYTADFDKLTDPPKSSNSDIDNYKIAPIFDKSNPNIAGAIFEFPVEGFKSSKSSGNCVYMFHVMKGLVEVNLSNNTFAVTRGCSFQVPSGNTYGITNIGNGSAKLFCVQVLPQ